MGLGVIDATILPMSLKEIVLPETLTETGLDIRRSVLLVTDYLNEPDFLELTTKNLYYISVGIAKQGGVFRFFFADTVKHSQLEHAIKQEISDVDKLAYGQIFFSGRGLLTRLFLKTRIWDNDKQMKQILVAFFAHIDPDLIGRTVTLDIPEGDYRYHKADGHILKKVF